SCAACSPIPPSRRAAGRRASRRSRGTTAPCGKRSSSSHASSCRSRSRPRAMVRADSRAVSDLHERVTRVWQGGVGPAASRALDVAARGYRGLLDAREWLYGRGVLRCRALGVPVVSVGNLTVGGTGKTPAVELVVRTLLALGHRPAVLSRGYGRRGHGIRVVADSSSMRLNADEAGDEPILLARRLPGVPVIVGAHRYGAGRVAVERFGVTALVLDDGFQHRTLAKDVEILMARARALRGPSPLHRQRARHARAARARRVRRRPRHHRERLDARPRAAGTGDAAIRAGRAAGAALGRGAVARGAGTRVRAPGMIASLAIRLPNWLGDSALTDAVPLPASPRHQIDEYLMLAERCAAHADDTRPVLAPPPTDAAERVEARALLDAAGARRGRPAVGVHLGAAYGPAKTWPAERVVDVCRLLDDAGARAVLLGTADEAPTALAIAGQAPAAATRCWRCSPAGCGPRTPATAPR